MRIKSTLAGFGSLILIAGFIGLIAMEPPGSRDRDRAIVGLVGAAGGVLTAWLRTRGTPPEARRQALLWGAFLGPPIAAPYEILNPREAGEAFGFGIANAAFWVLAVGGLWSLVAGWRRASDAPARAASRRRWVGAAIALTLLFAGGAAWTTRQQGASGQWSGQFGQSEWTVTLVDRDGALQGQARLGPGVTGSGTRASLTVRGVRAGNGVSLQFFAPAETEPVLFFTGTIQRGVMDGQMESSQGGRALRLVRR